MDSLLDKVSNEYGLRLSLHAAVDKGFLSENHVLTDGADRYFLKKYRFKSGAIIPEMELEIKAVRTP